LLHEVGGDVGLDAVAQGSQRRRHGHRPEARAIRIADVGEVEHEAQGNAEASPAPGRGQRQVDLSGKNVREIVERQRRFVGEHAGLIAPEPEYDEVLVVAGREVHEPIDAAASAHHLPARLVLV
jgi:hypothetical protein